MINNNLKRKNEKPEEEISVQITQWIRKHYPDLIFFFDMSGSYMPFPVRYRMNRMRCGWDGKDKYGKDQVYAHKIPDLIILEPKKGYHAMLLEIKSEGKTPYKKDGTPKKNEHTEKQAIMLERLRQKNYAAFFAVGFADAVTTITAYLK